MLLLLVLLKDPNIVMPAKKSVPKNPVMVLVFPTNGVEEEMVSLTVYLIYLLKSHADVQELKFKSHRLAALTINMNRLAKAHSHSSHLRELVCKHVTMLCLSVMNCIRYPCPIFSILLFLFTYFISIESKSLLSSL